jgi:5-formyltetrahydrofolate cyclo-ligase
MTRKKTQLRRDMKRILANLDQRWVKAASHEVCKHLTTLLTSKIDRPIKHILAWAKFFPGEIDLSSFIVDQLENSALYLPRTFADGSMQFVRISDDWMNASEEGPFGIPQPRLNNGETQSRIFDAAWGDQTLVLIPGLAFDREGNRLGRGKGYYDKFFDRFRLHSALKVGVAWELQIVDQVPTESFDILVDWICHERGMIQTTLQMADEI